MTESTHLWKPLRDNLKEPHFERIENSAGAGRPDINGCFRGRTVDIELKIFKGNQLVFREGQPVWIYRRTQAGGRVVVLARKDDNLMLYSAIEATAKTVPHRVLASGDIAYTVLGNITPLFETSRPFRWPELQDAIFETRAANIRQN